MAEIIEIERKSAALRHPGSPCLSPYHTINLTAGCPCACRYCYAQSFRHYPGLGKVLFYANTLEKVRSELARKRKKPTLVHFSTSCEPFNPDPRILDALYGIMKMLLENSIGVVALTKAVVPPKFIALFKEHRDKVCLEVGITTANDRIRQLMEPGAASVEQRLKTFRDLVKNGIQHKAKMDPLIPGLTDGDEEFTALCRALAEEGVRDAAASYLFLRRTMTKRMHVRMDDWSFDDMVNRLYTGTITKYCGNGTIRVPAIEYKVERFRFLRRVALEHGIALRFCRCKNPGATQDRCHDLPESMKPKRPQRTLFEQGEHST